MSNECLLCVLTCLTVKNTDKRFLLLLSKHSILACFDVTSRTHHVDELRHLEAHLDDKCVVVVFHRSDELVVAALFEKVVVQTTRVRVA